jgi:hypothetical protein
MTVPSRNGFSRRERGATFLGIVALLVGISVVVTLSLRLGPHYVDWQTMGTLFDDLKKQDVHQMAPSSIRESLGKRFRVNNLRDYNLREIMKVERSKAETYLVVSYEKRESIMYNIDIVVSFNERYEYH